MTCGNCGASGVGAFCGGCGAKVELARPGPGLQAPLTAEIPAGVALRVAEGDVFVGLRHGAPIATLGPGLHAIEEALDGGAFLASAGLDITFEARLGSFADERGERAEIAARGVIQLVIDEPADWVARHPEGIDESAWAERARVRVIALLVERVRALLAQGRYFSTFASTRVLDELRVEVRDQARGDEDHDPATSLTLSKLQIGSQTAAASKPERPVSFAPGTTVRATWQDGSSFTGIVRATACQVVFDGGEERWVPLESLEEIEAEEPST